MKDFKVAICQTMTTSDKKKNIDNAVNMIEEAAKNGAELVVLPEIFNSPYDNKCFFVYAEEFPGETSIKMMEIAKEKNIFLLAGSISEKDGDKIYNTAYLYDRTGKMIARHRKMHLFDIDVKNGQYFKESDILTAGDDFTIVDTELGKIGIAICFDVRFPEYFRVLEKKGAEIVLLPAAFNMTTGPQHWEISVRMRAIDNQYYIVAASPARDVNVNYISYANSRIIDPWGRVIAAAKEEQTILYADISKKHIEDVREQIPILKGLRRDKYEVKFKE